MTKDEIKKALKTCSVDSCTDCPYDNKGLYCCGKLKRDALDLITEQEKENEKLEQLNAIQCDAWQKLSDENERLVTENNSNLRYNAVLRKENKKLKEEIKQAQIDVLNKIKNCRYATDSDCYPYLERIVNKLIKEVENEQKD